MKQRGGGLERDKTAVAREVSSTVAHNTPPEETVDLRCRLPKVVEEEEADDGPDW